MPRTIAIGDVHGCADELQELLDALKVKTDDTIIQIGDLVNRGPQSRRVIELARKYKIQAILGNHELRLLTALREKRPKILKDYDLDTIQQLEAEDWQYLEQLQKFKFDGKRDIVFVHGGFLPNSPWYTQPIEIAVNIQVINKRGKAAKRSDAPEAPSWTKKWKGPPFVIYGHTPRRKVMKQKYSLGIDTGCVYGGKLTAYVVEDDSFVQVKAHRVYALSKRLPKPV
ncbi:MAG: Bis(5'-nucleosyl)-tetraphosphatase PrpE [asymmetrical] [Opitutia bacterium UBA7350]|nr:MAG: Bis(5'-nucleosyl)-tetraphosphatase PrpE [asymmetrical] [Opitutae bacterium UBA7350]